MTALSGLGDWDNEQAWAPPRTVHRQVGDPVGEDSHFAEVISEDWMADALCVGEPPDDWFVRRGEPHREIRKQRAIQICRGCPVRKECLQFAIENDLVQDGIWGAHIPGEGRSHAVDSQPPRESSWARAHQIETGHQKFRPATMTFGGVSRSYIRCYVCGSQG